MPEGNVVMRVQRADGRIEFGAGVDGFALLTEQARSAIISLDRLDDARINSRHVCALLVEAPPAVRGLETQSTTLVPKDPVLGGAMLFAGLVAARKTSPAAFAECMRRLRDAGLVSPEVRLGIV